MRLPESSLLAERHARARAALGTLGLDALVVTAPANVRYLTNHVGSAGILVMTGAAMHLLVDFRYDEAVRSRQESSAACPGLQIWPVPASYDEALLACLTTIEARQVGFEAAHLTVARYRWLSGALDARGTGIALVPTERIVEQLRVVKDAFEIALLRDAASRLGAVADAAFRAIRAGVTEREVAAAIDAAIRGAGYERCAFDTIVASGPHAAHPHHRAGDRRLEPGDLVVLDFGGVLDGYCCDLTRTVTLGPPGTEARRVHAAVREAQQAAVAAVAPGVLTSTVDAAARSLLAAHGLAEAFGHGTGHGLGLDVHEEPRINRQRLDAPAIPLQPGMVFTIEPGAYVPGWGGVRIEDDVLVTGTGCEVLTAVPRDLVCLG